MSRRKRKAREWKEKARAERQEERHKQLEEKERKDDDLACRLGVENV